MSAFLAALDEIEVERILGLTHVELVAEIKARGEDPDKIIREIDETIQRAKRYCYEAEKLRSANGQTEDR